MTDNESTLRMTEAIGPYYDFDGVRTGLNRSEIELNADIFTHDVLAAITSDGFPVFPVWQFSDDGSINADLLEVAKILYSAEHPSYYAQDGSMLPGAGWFTLSFLVMQYPFTLHDGTLSPNYRDAERKPIYQHLQQGSLTEEILWEVKEQYYLMNS